VVCLRYRFVPEQGHLPLTFLWVFGGVPLILRPRIQEAATFFTGGVYTVTFTAGVLASHSVTISDMGSFSITATDSATGLGTGTESVTSAAFTVDP